MSKILKEALRVIDRPRAAEVFPPRNFINEELEARGWLRQELAVRMRVNVAVVFRVLDGLEPMPEDWPEKLAHAFGTSADIWRNLETTWRESQS